MAAMPAPSVLQITEVKMGPRISSNLMMMMMIRCAVFQHTVLQCPRNQTTMRQKSRISHSKWSVHNYNTQNWGSLLRNNPPLK